MTDKTATSTVARGDPALALFAGDTSSCMISFTQGETGLIKWGYTMRNPEKLDPDGFATMVE